jgi:hypothetical protein
MRRRRRRRSRSARTYSIGYLLSRQPKGLRKHEHYSAMMAHYYASERLQRLRMSRRCYTLLNNARIRPRNLHHFYRTYRLPSNPFFPLFFSIKRDYLAERERIREERRRYIRDSVRALPPPILTFIKYLGYLERYYNAAGLSPVWQKELFPTSKKQADAYQRYTTGDWLRLFREHLSSLEQRYRGLSEIVADRVFACIVLELTPELIPPARPDQALINRSYRRLSLLHHPDRGGDPRMFIQIKRARDVLVEGRPGG